MLLYIDSTFATPFVQRPIELGADVVLHSGSKYFGGHSDLLGGALVVRDKTLLEKLYFVQNATGGMMGPFESYLCSRGIKTLELRVREQCRTALLLAEWLEKHSGVSRVLYPGLASHPGHALAVKQMDGGFGAMLSFEFKSGFAGAKKFVVPYPH